QVASPALLDEVEAAHAAAAPTPARRAVVQAQRDARTAVVVAVDGRPAAVLSLADRPRVDAAATVAELRTLTAHAPVLLTGDNPVAAHGLAAQVGLTEVHAGLLPADKLAHVEAMQHHGRRVLLIGDGVNDAPAMAAAHLGIAMGRGGSDLALQTADAITVHDDLAAIPRVIALARRARRVVIANLVIAGTIIAVLVAWDLLGTLPLPLAVAGHEGSTVLVGLNGLRLLRRSAWEQA
ncbi:MAG: HAD-IC family P-type ATPase, partial [Mycobacteriaceae bacterium]